jgi:Flp pilus assembly protein TadG
MENFSSEETRKVESAPRFLKALRTGEHSGQAIVEFAMVSVAFFSIVFGTIDFGRAIYMYSELTNAVREGARYGKLHPEQSEQIKATVRAKSPTLNGEGGVLLTVDDPSCTGGCRPGCSDVTVSAEYDFKPIVANFLGIDDSITLRASTRVEAE